jgi:GT2 family glycosyltransferase
MNFAEWLSRFPANAPVIAIPIYNAFDDVIECIDSLRRHTPADVPLLALDDASTDARIQSTLQAMDDARFFYHRKPANSGFVGTVNLAFEMCKPRDVVLMNSDVVVPAEWLPRLRDAACDHSTIATATPFTNHGSILSLPNIDQPSNDLPLGWPLEELDARVRHASLRLRPTMPTCIGHCVYVKRLALDAVGAFDEAFAPGYGEEVDFSQRCVKAGLSHVVCDDLFVYHKGSRSFGHDPEKEKKRIEVMLAHEQIINERYPWYAAWRANLVTHPDHPLARAQARARASLVGYRIAIDATSVANYTAGTQVVALELSHAITQWLAANNAGLPCPMHVTIILNDALPEAQFNEMASRMNAVRLMQVRKDASLRFDLIHRPFQTTSVRDLAMLQTLARRCIVSQLDCIAYSNPSYMHDEKQWLDYRRTNEAALAMADGVIYISEEGRREAEHLGLHVPAERACVTHLGVDHAFHGDDAGARLALPNADAIRPPHILLIGTDFQHKNRVFALRVANALTTKFGWQGSVVIAGPTVNVGSSLQAETAALAQMPALQGRVLRMGQVDERQKAGLMKGAALVLYPSLREGFGMVPFEAAGFGTPALTLRISSQQEVLGDGVRYIETLDVDAAADLAWSLMTDEGARQAQVQATQAQAARFTWRKVAEDTLGFYDRVLQMPQRISPSLKLEGYTDEAPVERNWFQRSTIAVRVLFKEGWPGLRRTVNEYLTWKRGQF